jgi:hypothetical protein
MPVREVQRVEQVDHVPVLLYNTSACSVTSHGCFRIGRGDVITWWCWLMCPFHRDLMCDYGS